MQSFETGHKDYGLSTKLYDILSAQRLIFPGAQLLQSWFLFKPFVQLLSVEAVETVLTNGKSIDKPMEYGLMQDWLGEGLITSNGSKWRSHRKTLTKVFHFKLLEHFVEVMERHSNVLTDKLRCMAAQGQTVNIDVMPFVTLCTLDTICETAMGFELDSQLGECTYAKNVHAVTNILIQRFTKPWLWLDMMFLRSELGHQWTECLRNIKSFTNNVLEKRKKSLLESVDKNANIGSKSTLIDLLLNEHLNEKTLSLQDVSDEIETFMFGGHDTTATTIGWTLYMLGLHQDIQEKVRQEVRKIRQKAASFDLSNLKEMKLLGCVIKESLRLFPTVPFMGRELSEDIEVCGFKLPKGLTVGILPMILHQNPEVFPKPALFLPDRFLPENSKTRNPFSFLPFSAGSRNCIGQKYAMAEVKIVISNIVENFKIESLDQRDKIILVPEIVLRSANGIRLKLEPLRV
ncbi:Cytochrome P450 4V2 [Halotydeus destructor]|nr:Cytochrome P450 4V2 [Halotydeus destructor]